MDFNGQRVLPAIRQMKDFERLLDGPNQYLILLDSHVAQLESINNMVRRKDKRLLLHADLIHGLKSDEYAMEFLCQKIKPFGIISTRSNTLSIAKKRGLLTVQRLFLLDSMALETGYRQLEKIHPDFIEVLPGILPSMIKELRNQFNTPIIAGGLIRKNEDVDRAIEAGATAVTTSLSLLWK